MSRNPVKKAMDRVTRPTTHKDKKKDFKKGKRKHKEIEFQQAGFSRLFST